MTNPLSKEGLERIAAGLSEPMKVALDRLCRNFCWADGRSIAALERRGLAFSRMLLAFGETPDRLSVPTELGRVVSAHLLKGHEHG